MAKMGRPKKEFDWHLLDSLLPLKASLDYCCERLILKEGEEVNKTSIEAMRKFVMRRIQERYGLTFVQYREQKMEGTKINIFATQLDLALKQKNPTMLIWLGKAVLGQQDSTNVKITAEKMVAQAPTEDLVEAAKKQIAKFDVVKGGKGA